MDQKRNTLKQVLKERCLDVIDKISDDDINKLVDAGYTIVAALAAAALEDLVAVLPERCGVVGLLLKAFVQPIGMFRSQGFPMTMLIFGVVIKGICDFRV